MIRRLSAVAIVVTAIGACSSSPEVFGHGPAPTPATTPPAAPPPAITPVLARAIADPIPVPASDGNTHLAYELVLSNATYADVSLNSLEVRDGNRTLLQLAGDRLVAQTHVLGKPSATLGPGQNGYLWLDVMIPDGQPVPTHLTHELSAGVSQPKPPLLPPVVTHAVADIAVQQRSPVAIAPPLRGPNWLDANGCCEMSPHRTALNPIDGALWVAERFAIDYLQLMSDRRLFTGNPAQVTSYPYFGADIHAVADGPVVAVVDGLPEQVPTSVPNGLPLDQYTGNHVVQDLGNGNYALYAHLQTGSITVKPGDRLATGQVLAHLGNTGNSDAPHLHFQVMSTPDTLRSDGLPFVFSSFDLLATLPDSQDELIAGKPALAPTSTAPRVEKNVMPLQNDLMTYDAH